MTETDICNLALAALGDEATVVSIDPPEGSAQADHCAQWYPIARDTLLEAHDWTFARQRATLALTQHVVAPYAYAYAKPSAALRLLAVLPPDATSDDQAVPFTVETLDDGTEVILTDQAQAVLRYTRREVDVGRFPPLFVSALTHWLAGYLAGPALKAETGRAEGKAQKGIAMALLGNAATSDANQMRASAPRFVPSHLAARAGVPGVRR